MFDEPGETPSEAAPDPTDRVRDKLDEFRMHAELAAVFEGPRKFDALIRPNLDPQLARDSQQTIGRLEKSRSADSPLLPQESAVAASNLLNLPQNRGLATNDYHIYRRPGEVMIFRWLQADQVETFYQRLQAHFDAALGQFVEDERVAHGWKQDPQTMEYLRMLQEAEVRMTDRYLRDLIRKHNLFVLSTQTVDEMDILHLCDYLMGVEAARVVGAASAPPQEPSEQDRAWFFKLFSLRGTNKGREQMCFFAYLQKTAEY